MMNERRRRIFLSIMNIDVWLLRGGSENKTEYDKYRYHHNDLSEAIEKSLSSITKLDKTCDFSKSNIVSNATDIKKENLIKISLKKSKSPHLKEKELSLLKDLEKSTKSIVKKIILGFFYVDGFLIVVDFSSSLKTYLSERESVILTDMLLVFNKENKIQQIVEPLIWPILNSRNQFVSQNEEAACAYIQAALFSLMKRFKSTHLWLIGDAAWRFLGFDHLDEKHFFQIKEVSEKLEASSAWLLPNLSELIESPQLKARFWQRARYFLNALGDACVKR